MQGSTKPVSAYKAAPRTFVSAAPKCPRCDKSVYAAEQVLGPAGREYHRSCLTCKSCRKTLGPGAFQEHEGDSYCKHCYSKNFGPKGYGHGGSMAGEYHDPVLLRSPYSSPARGSLSERLQESPTKNSETAFPPRHPLATTSRTSIESPISIYNRSVLRSNEREEVVVEDQPSRSMLDLQKDASNAPPASDRSVSPAKVDFSPNITPLHVNRNSIGARPDSPASSVGTSARASSSNGTGVAGGGVGYKSNLGLLGSAGKDLCRRCGTVVYFAEKVMAGGHKWHKRCLRCAKCSKALDSHLMEKDSLPYCKKCYDEAWGLRAQGFVLRPGLH